MAFWSPVSRKPVRIFVMNLVFSKNIATNTTGLAVPYSGERCTLCST